MNRRERIIELATQIAQARQSLRAMETEMDSLLPTEEAASATPTAKPVYSSNPDNNAPLTERVIQYLALNRGRAFNAGDIATGVGLDREKITSLRSTLVRLVEEKRIERSKPGLYRAIQEQHHAAA